MVIDPTFPPLDFRNSELYKLQVIELAAISCHYPEIVRLCGFTIKRSDLPNKEYSDQSRHLVRIICN